MELINLVKEIGKYKIEPIVKVLGKDNHNYDDYLIDLISKSSSELDLDMNDIDSYFESIENMMKGGLIC